jgi:hypothetical protein
VPNDTKLRVQEQGSRDRSSECGVRGEGRPGMCDLILRSSRGRKRYPELMEQQPWPKVLIAAIQLLDPPNTAQVTLLADRITQRRREGARIDDRDVAAVDHHGLLDVKVARAVTPLAADRIVPNERSFIPINCTDQVLDTVNVAE